jgi:hypothetical protein
LHVRLCNPTRHLKLVADDGAANDEIASNS